MIDTQLIKLYYLIVVKYNHCIIQLYLVSMEVDEVERTKLAETVLHFIPSLNRRFFRMMPKFDFSKQQIGLLHMLTHNGHMPMKVFSDKMHISKPNLTKLVNHLIDEGLVIRSHSEKDRRIILLDITDEGKKVVDSHYKMMVEQVTEMFLVYDDDEIDQLGYHFAEINRLISKIDVNKCDKEKGNLC